MHLSPPCKVAYHSLGIKVLDECVVSAVVVELRADRHSPSTLMTTNKDASRLLRAFIGVSATVAVPTSFARRGLQMDTGHMKRYGKLPQRLTPDDIPANPSGHTNKKMSIWAGWFSFSQPLDLLAEGYSVSHRHVLRAFRGKHSRGNVLPSGGVYLGRTRACCPSGPDRYFNGCFRVAPT